jgi:hypothetical protein
MLEEQRDMLEEMGGVTDIEQRPIEATGTASVYRHLYETAIVRGELAAASPWFDRYCDEFASRSLGIVVKDASDRKWRGPINRLR